LAALALGGTVLTDKHLFIAQRQPDCRWPHREPNLLAVIAKLEDKSFMTDLSFSFPPAMLDWLEQRVAQGDYVDAGDYLRDLIRRDQQAAENDAAWVRAMIAEGEASGFIEADPAQVIEDIIAEISASDA